MISQSVGISLYTFIPGSIIGNKKIQENPQKIFFSKRALTLQEW